jgi:hypothetical protein
LWPRSGEFQPAREGNSWPVESLRVHGCLNEAFLASVHYVTIRVLSIFPGKKSWLN